MKNFVLTGLTAIATLLTIERSSGQANTSLSNLVLPTRVNTHLSPGTNGAFDLGAAATTWRNFWLTGYVYMDGAPFLANQGTENNFIGTNAGKSTTGSYNFASGFTALYSNTTGSSNTAAGTEALYTNTTGAYNTAVGDLALYRNVSGNYNTALGMSTLNNNTIGAYNTAGGYFALGYNTSGTYNTANGYFALLSNTTGTYNTGSGAYALNHNTTGFSNVATGGYALSSSTTASYNTATGTNSLTRNTSGNYNTFTGMNSGYSNTSGTANTGMGYNSLLSTTGSYYNTAVGYSSGDSYDNGYNNVFLGANTDVNGPGYYNVIAIGQDVTCTGSSQARFGNMATNSIGGYVNFTNISDGRVKRNIQQNVPGLTFINKLQPVTYNLDLEAIEHIIQPPVQKDADGKVIEKTAVELKARKDKEQVVYSGFIAQDVEKAAKNLGFDFSGVDAAKNDKDLYGLRYAEFTVPLVKAVQELSKLNDEKDTKLADLQEQINELKKLVAGNMSLSNAGNILPGAYLAQNTPNPFGTTTSIHYMLPQNYATAKIVVSDSKGAMLREYTLNATSGNVLVDASTLSSGAYSYALFVNGKRIETKQMISAK